MKNIWDKFKIKNIKLQNRIVRSATNEHLGTKDGIITDAYIEVYKDLAKQGIGLIITSHMAILKDQRADLTHICINEYENFDKLKKLTKEIHAYNQKIICQISCGGRRASKIFKDKTFSPSGNDNAKIMSKEDIDICINNYVSAIKVAKETGFDGVQIHLAHGYLLSEFLNPFYNKRTDEYGGSTNNRYRIIHEILLKVNDLILDPNFLITVKIDSSLKNDNEDFIKNQIEICKLLEVDGISAIEVSGEDFRKYKQSTPYYLDNALRIKNAVSVPIILVGGFRNEDKMNDAINKGIDLVSCCRAFIADNNFIEKLKNKESSRCISCNKCFEIYKTLYKRCIFDEKINSGLYENFHND